MTSTEEYRSRINQKSENVKEEPEMKKMRDDISEGIGTTGNRQADVEEQFQQVIEETTDKDIVSAPEIIAARNGKPNLKQRLDDENENVTRQLAQKAQQDDLIVERARINNLVANAGDTDGNAELLDIRVGFDGEIYDTAGEAVRAIGAFLTEEGQYWEV